MDQSRASYDTMTFVQQNSRQCVALELEIPKPKSYSEELNMRDDLARQWITKCEDFIRSCEAAVHILYNDVHPATVVTWTYERYSDWDCCTALARWVTCCQYDKKQ
jgi:hypothetical protein